MARVLQCACTLYVRQVRVCGVSPQRVGRCLCLTIPRFTVATVAGLETGLAAYWNTGQTYCQGRSGRSVTPPVHVYPCVKVLLPTLPPSLTPFLPPLLPSLLLFIPCSFLYPLLLPYSFPPSLPILELHISREIIFVYRPSDCSNCPLITQIFL